MTSAIQKSILKNDRVYDTPAVSFFSFFMTDIVRRSIDFTKNGAKKTVAFGNIVEIILIPTRAEYRGSALGDNIWWQKNDLEGFKDSAIKEIERSMVFSGLSNKQVQIILYQPLPWEPKNKQKQ